MARNQGEQRKTPVSQLPRDLVYGRNPVQEAMRHGYLRRAFLLDLNDKRHRPLREQLATAGVEAEEMAQAPWFPALKGAAHQGAAGIIRRFQGLPLREVVEKLGPGPAAVILADGINDPQNLGAVIRDAAATGAAVILPKHDVPSINCTVHKAAAGYTFRTPIVLDENLAQAVAYLQQRDFWVAALDAHEGESIFDFDFPARLGLVVGSEERRVRHLLRQRSDFLLRIPMASGVDSLNLSVSVGVVLCFYRAHMEREARAGSPESPSPDVHSPD